MKTPMKIFGVLVAMIVLAVAAFVLYLAQGDTEFESSPIISQNSTTATGDPIEIGEGDHLVLYLGGRRAEVSADGSGLIHERSGDSIPIEIDEPDLLSMRMELGSLRRSWIDRRRPTDPAEDIEPLPADPDAMAELLRMDNTVRTLIALSAGDMEYPAFVSAVSVVFGGR